MKTTMYFLVATFLLSGINVHAQDYKVNLEKSKLKWTGKKVAGEHYGFIDLKSGSFSVKDNKIATGEFKIDMTTIVNKDLDSPEWNQKLVGHLKSDDFFSVDKHPVSKLKITESGKFKNNVAEVKGMLTIKGITHPVTFKVKKEGNKYSSSVVVDRTKYDIRYGSGKFFDNLGDNMIDDDFVLDVTILVSK